LLQRKCDPFEQKLLKIAKNASQGENGKPLNEIDSFLAHLAPKMQRIQQKSNLKLTQLQIKIQQIVLESEEDLME